ncbi:MAG TPA: hypothetical protein VKZ81_29375 [Pseudonocardia sp.]|jgi:hypothetical protein|uniref:hypothetical protein n=1 Tax=Pseudonocardia sp. TaxID=60912 RepID=UPI002B4B8E94|nr:hypothetical protein [Pseudonocardia sp.]HLU59594.1 hypothetical protein [Pseudonocardia sp.]
MANTRWIDASSMAIGLPIGVAIGLLLGNVAFGIPIGLIFAMALAWEKGSGPAREDGAPEDDRGA